MRTFLALFFGIALTLSAVPAVQGQSRSSAPPQQQRSGFRPNCDTGLRAHWTFDDVQEFADDVAGYNNRGRLMAGAGHTWDSAPYYGGWNSLTLNGESSWVQVDDMRDILPDANSDRTIAAWVQQHEKHEEATILSLGTDPDRPKYMLQLAKHGPDRTFLFSDGLRPENAVIIPNDIAPPLGSWHHVAFSNSRNHWRYYLDGQLRAEGDFGAPLDTHLNAATIGGRLDPPYNGHYRGFIDTLRVYDHALPDNVVRALADGTCG